MSFLQRNLPILVLGFAGLLIALGTFGFVQTQRELPARDLTILADEQGSGYFQVAERHTKRTVLRQIEIELPEMSMADADVALARLNDLEANVTQRVRVSWKRSRRPAIPPQLHRRRSSPNSGVHS